jgi:hypothetical protein
MIKMEIKEIMDKKINLIVFKFWKNIINNTIKGIIKK